MNTDEFLRKSHLDYPEKATWHLYGVDNASLICPDCHSPPVNMSERITACCERCPFALMIWLLNKRQAEIWLKVRPLDMKRKEVEKAVSEQRKISHLKEVIGRVSELSPLPVFFDKITKMIKFEDFKKIDLRVVKIIKAERVTDSEKLIKLEVDGGEEKRQIVAGIGKCYRPEDLIDKEIIMVWNLEPKILFGLESKGMLLAAEDEKGPVLLIVDKEVSPGTKIR